MDFHWIKEWAPVVSTTLIPLVIAILRIGMKVSKDLDEVKDLVPIVKSHEERLDAHDRLATSVFGIPISSEMLAEGKQAYPLFNKRKPREDH